MKVLVFGRTGQVARELARRKPEGVELVSLSRAEADLLDPDACVRRVAEHAPDVVIIAAAFTGVDAAEDHASEADVVNARAPEAIARACREQGRALLHLSTDYVFDGRGRQPWSPEAAPAPLGVYGRTKRAGEVGVLEAMPDATILRTSWVFSAHGRNFVRTMLDLGSRRNRLQVVDDQIGGPTAAADIADALFAIAGMRTAGRGAPGIHHFAGRPAVSWADFARAIFVDAGQDVTIESIPSSAYPTRAARPLNSRLDGTSTTAAFGIAMPEWRPALQQVIAELEPEHD